MSLNDTPSANRVHIGFFGCRNAGKSSLVNAVTGQSLAVVSDVAGTTTDPVYKSMELLPLGPVVIIDTPGIDDTGELGELRVSKTRQVLAKIDVAVLVVDGSVGLSAADRELTELFKEKNINYIIAYNKSDLVKDDTMVQNSAENSIWVSAERRQGIEELKELIGKLTVTDTMTRRLVGDLIQPGDMVVLVIPIDSAAPKGRLILPQQQVIRDVLETGATAVVCRDTELEDTLRRLEGKVSLVVTDSQAFAKVMKIVPYDIYLTSFSILMARFKGQLDAAVNGAYVLDRLRDEGQRTDADSRPPRILIAEGCTHHRQCGDIGSVKLPNWLKEYTGKNLEIVLSSGHGFPEELSDFALCIHCGGCMLGSKELTYRMKCACDADVPFSNYGIAIAYMKGILKRSIEVFPHLVKELEDHNGGQRTY